MRAVHFLYAALLITAIIRPPAAALEAKSDERLTSVRADSTRKDPRDSYQARDLIDGTARSWCEGSQGDGVGRGFRVDFRRPVRIKSIYIKNGFGNVNYWLTRNRVRQLIVAGQKVRVQDVRGWQRIDLPRAIRGKSVSFRIDSVYHGVKSRDTCIEEISFRRQKISPPNLPDRYVGHWTRGNAAFGGGNIGLILKAGGTCVASRSFLARAFIYAAAGPVACLWEVVRGDEIVLHFNGPLTGLSAGPITQSNGREVRKISLRWSPSNGLREACLKLRTYCMVSAAKIGKDWVATPFECDFHRGFKEYRLGSGEYLRYVRNPDGIYLHHAPDRKKRTKIRLPCGTPIRSKYLKFDSSRSIAAPGSESWAGIQLPTTGGKVLRGWIDMNQLAEHHWRDYSRRKRYIFGGGRFIVEDLKVPIDQGRDNCGINDQSAQAECLMIVRNKHLEISSILPEYGQKVRPMGSHRFYNEVKFKQDYPGLEPVGVIRRVYNLKTNAAQDDLFCYHGKYKSADYWTLCRQGKCFLMTRKRGRMTIYKAPSRPTLAELAYRFNTMKAPPNKGALHSIRVRTGKVSPIAFRARDPNIFFRIGYRTFKIDIRTNRIRKSR